ncbi:MAG: hypothetical protein AAF701_08985 [Pseudomonadota bacterium]
MRRPVIILLACIITGAGAYWWTRPIQPFPETGRFVRDLRSVDQRAVCTADDVQPGGLRIDPKHVIFAEQTCDIVTWTVYQKSAVPEADYITIPTLYYRCGDGQGPGPHGASGDISVAYGRAQLTGYIDVPSDPRGYIPAHASFPSCKGYIDHD